MRRRKRCARFDIDKRLRGSCLHVWRHSPSTAGWPEEGLAHFCGYGARPPLTQERLSIRDGKLAYRMKRRLGDGRDLLILEPSELLRRLATLVPPPRAHPAATRAIDKPVLGCSSGTGSTTHRARCPRRQSPTVARLTHSLERAPPPPLPRGCPCLPLRWPPQGYRLHQREGGDRADPRAPRRPRHRPAHRPGPLRELAAARRRARVAAIAALTDSLAPCLLNSACAAAPAGPREALLGCR